MYTDSHDISFVAKIWPANDSSANKSNACAAILIDRIAKKWREKGK